MKGLLIFAALAVIILALGVWVATPFGGGSLGEDEPPGGVTEAPVDDRADGVVEIIDGEFQPSTVEALPNTQVTFQNRDDVPRGVQFDDDELESAEEIPPGGAHVVEVPDEGTFSFTSPEDEGQEGTIEVAEE